MLYLIHKGVKLRLRYLLLTLGTAYLALTTYKSLLLFAICGFFPLAFYYKDFDPPVKEKNVNTKKTLLLRKVLISIIALMIPLTLYLSNGLNKETDLEHKMLEDTVSFILEHDKVSDVTLYTGYGTGGMAEFMGIPAYMDARSEVFAKRNNKKADVLKEYFDLQAGKLYYKEVLNKYKFTHLILSKNDILYIYLKHDKDYKAVFINESYTLYKRISSPVIQK